MAELNSSSETSLHITTGARYQRFACSKKLSTKVDLTPMVDLGFLLITFFIITTTMSEPKAMPLYVPKGLDSSQVVAKEALTVLPVEDNKIFYYHGELEEAINTGAYGLTSYSLRDGVGTIIRRKQLIMENSGSTRKGMILLIKPAKQATYQNIVDLMDEIMINDIKRYSLLEINSDEEAIIRKQVN